MSVWTNVNPDSVEDGSSAPPTPHDSSPDNGDTETLMRSEHPCSGLPNLSSEDGNEEIQIDDDGIKYLRNQLYTGFEAYDGQGNTPIPSIGISKGSATSNFDAYVYD
jgi:hypothetical protein